MSYGINIKVRKVKDALDALNFIQNFKINFDIVDYISEFKHPMISEYLRNYDIEEFNFNNQREFIENYISKLSTLTFFYWPEYNILALLERNLDTHEYKKFSPDCLNFQNYTDQDYPKDYWSCLPESVFDGLEETPDDYEGRTKVYDYVFNKLMIDDLFEYPDENTKIIRLDETIRPEDLSWETYNNLKKKIKEAFAEYIEERKTRNKKKKK